MTQTAPASPADADAPFADDGRTPQGLGESVRTYLIRAKNGDVGGLPAVLGLVVLCIYFTAQKPDTFPTALNFANLLTQAAAITVLALGLVFVLLLGEIDLSAGVTGGMCAAVLAKLLLDAEASWWVATLGALAAGVVVGLLIGILVSYVGIPSFVVTLALFLALQGVTLRLIGQGGTFPVNNEVISSIANDNMPIWLGWTAAIVGSALFGALQLNAWRVRQSKNLVGAGLSVVLVRIAAVAVILLAITAVLSRNRARVANVTLSGIPWAVPLILVLVVLATFVLGRTSYGRHLYAIGGNAEAARRAGINVNRLRISVFVIGSTLAAVSGIIEASRLSSVTAASGSGNTLLFAVGAAVIGGTSLFGGKGKALDAVVGGLVIAVIANGLGLQGYTASVQFLVTGGVLLLAASVDALSRKRRAATGR